MSDVERPVSLPPGLPALRVIPMPSDVNCNGFVFGGWLLTQIDLACFVPASTRAAGPVTTVSINSLVFEAPIHVGDLVNIYAEIVRVGRTSMTIRVEVYTQRNLEKPEYHRVASGEWVFVAVDEDHRPRPIPHAPASP